MDSNLSALIELGENVAPSWMYLCRTVLNDKHFQEGVASSSHHPGPHQHPGGLVLHTLEVAQTAVGFSGTDAHLRELAYVSAVFHDSGKIYEYQYKDGEASKLPFSKRVGHIVWGWKFFLEVSERDERLADIDEIGHAILAHHGRREWGSPVEPCTRLAYILHTADMLSARSVIAQEQALILEEAENQSI